MKTRAVIAFIIFLAILTLPFSINAINGNMFSGAPLPQLGSAQNQYGLLSRQLPGAIPVPNDIMQNHMVHIGLINQSYGGTQNCLKCHDRTQLCDRCHSYVGIKPSIGS
ncbi:MAG: hypothetical protein ACYCXU_07395 [Thermoleophilia bacterium]